MRLLPFPDSLKPAGSRLVLFSIIRLFRGVSKVPIIVFSTLRDVVLSGSITSPAPDPFPHWHVLAVPPSAKPCVANRFPPMRRAEAAGVLCGEYASTCRRVLECLPQSVFPSSAWRLSTCMANGRDMAGMICPFCPSPLPVPSDEGNL